jgi:flavin-dependent dehydrogenase
VSGPPDVDVLVAGGGPVGLAAGLEARRRGLSVTVVEPREGPVDKACGEGLMPTALARLGDLGVRVDGVPFVGIRYVCGGRSASARFRSGPGLGVRRTVLHEALARRADDAGVERVRGSVGPVVQDGSGVHAAGRRALWLVAADGLHSPVRRGLGLDVAVPHPARFGLRRHFAVAPWSDHVEVHWTDRAEAYVTPVAGDLVGVAVLGPAGVGFDDVLADLPALAARLGGAEPVTGLRGAGPLRQQASAVRSRRVVLVGDAAGYVDALTGEGLSTGLATARSAVAALAAGRPEDYPVAWARDTRRYRVLTSALLSVTSRRRPRALLVPAAERLPWVFGRVVDLLA